MIICNLLGFAWILIAGIIGMGANLLLGRAPGGMDMGTMGVVLFLCDFGYRWVLNAPGGARQLLRLSDGGHMAFVPIWIWGLVFSIGAFFLSAA